MRHLATSIVLLLLLPAAPAAAVEVQLGWKSEMEYDSRVLGEDDLIFNFGPTTEITREGRRLSYRLYQATTYEKYLDHAGLDDVRLRLSGSANYALTPHVMVDVSNNFSRTPLLRSGERLETEDEIAAAAARGEVLDATFEGDTGTLISNSFSSGLSWSPTERLTLNGRVLHLFREFDNESLNAQNTSSVSVSSQGTYRAFKDHQFGAGFRFSQRDFEVGGLQGDENRTVTYNAFAVWNWMIDERSTFSATAGPAWSEDDTPEEDFALFPTIPGSPAFLPDPITCPLFVINGFPVLVGGLPVAFVDPRCQPISQTPLTPDQQARLADIPAGLVDVRGSSEDQTDVNAFFTLSIDRNWDRLSLLAQWSRSDSQTQSLGSSTVVDTFYLQSNYWLTRRLRIGGNFRFSRRDTDFSREVLTPLLGVVVPVPIPGLPGFEGAPVIAAAPFQQEVQQTNDAYTAQLRLTHLWGRSSRIYAGAFYRHSENSFEINGITGSSSFDEWQFQIGFEYFLDPIRF
jgi:hypothetical protein